MTSSDVRHVSDGRLARARRWSTIVLASGAAALSIGIAGAADAVATTSFNEVTDRTELMQVFDRFGGETLLLVGIAIAIVALLVWRVLVMIRRDRPTPLPARPRPRRGADGDLADLQGRTDWGFDQNKRAALVRSPVTVTNADVDLPSLDSAVTQWTMSDVVAANSEGVQPKDALGQSPAKSASPYRTSFNPYFNREAPAVQHEVVEVADTLLQAELLVQLGDPKQAMSLLSRHIRETEKPGAATWLMLLRLYQSTGREAQYNALSTGFRTLFNADVPPWATSAENASRDLESYATAIAKLQSIWSGPNARAIVEALLNDDRGGSRQGFSLAAYAELLFLAEILGVIAALDQEDEDRKGISRKLARLPS